MERVVCKSILKIGCDIRECKFSHDQFRELKAYALTMHDLLFNIVEYVGIKNIFLYLSLEIDLISKNTAKSDVLKLYI